MATVTAELTKGTEVTTSNGRHSWGADQPVLAGGTDTGATPLRPPVGYPCRVHLHHAGSYCRHKKISLKS